MHIRRSRVLLRMSVENKKDVDGAIFEDLRCFVCRRLNLSRSIWQKMKVRSSLRGV